MLALASTALLAVAPRAHAYEARVEASLDAQFYALRSPFGEPVVQRRRTTSTLGLELDDLTGETGRKPAPTLRFRSRLRVDADYAIDPAELDPSSPRHVPGLSEAPLDIMYAYFEGNRFAGGAVGFRVGRQYVVDALGFWSFDGALLRLTPPVPFELSGFAGFEQRTGVPMLATSRFSAQGVQRGDRGALELREHPNFLDDSALAPAVGVALETAELSEFHARLSYRKVHNRSSVLVSPFADELGGVATFSRSRTSSERAAASARLDLPALGAVSAHGAYDLYLQLVSDAALAIDWYATAALTLGADVEYEVPTYDGDSIFNWFTHGPATTAQLRASFAPSRAFDVATLAGVRLLETEGDPVTFGRPIDAAPPERSITRSVELVANAAARYRFRATTLALAATGQGSDSGHLAGADLSARRSYSGGRYDSLVLLSVYDWSDALRASRDATSFTYVLGAGLSPGLGLISDGRLGVEWEHTLNRLVAQRFRLLLTLDFSVLP